MMKKIEILTTNFTFMPSSVKFQDGGSLESASSENEAYISSCDADHVYR